MIKNIIFDWSGVIKDSIEDHLYSSNKVFQRFGAPQMTLEELKNAWVQPHMVFYNTYLPDLTSDEEAIVYKQAIMECSPKVYSGIVQLIKELHSNGFNMVVISSDLMETVDPELVAFDLEGMFTEVVPNLHDKTEMVKQLITKYHFDTSETVIIGDTNHEIEVGKLVGIKTIAVTWGFTPEARLVNNYPDFIVHDLDELKDCLLSC